MADNAAVIGALSVIIGGDASALNKMLAGAQNSVSSFAKNVTSIATGMGLEKAIEGALSALTGAIKQGLADADALAKMSQSTGVSIDTLSKLQYAGTLAGVSSQALGTALNKLSQGMTEFASGAVTPAAAALTALGVSVKNGDGTLKSSSTVLGEIADKFAGYKDGAAKAALAQALFGDGGAALVPLLNKGSAGLAEAGDEAQKFGLVLDGQTQFAVQSLNDNLTKMDAIKQGLVLTVVSKVLPAFEQVSVVLLNAKENSDLMSAAADGLGTVLKALVSEALLSTTWFQRLGAELGAFGKAFIALKDDGWSGFVAGLQAVDDEMEKSSQILGGLKTNIATLWTTPTGDWTGQIADIKFMQSEVQKLGLTWTQSAAPLLAATGASTNALQTFLDRTAKSTAAVDAQAQTVGKAADEQARLKVELEAQAISTAKNIPITDAYRAAIDAAANSAAAAAQKLAGNQLTQASLAPWEQRNQLLAQYKTLLDAGAISSATFATASMKIQFPSFTAAANSALDFGLQIDQLATNSLNGLASTLAQVVAGTKSAGEAFSAFAIQLITQLAEMIIKAVLFKIIMLAIGFSGGGPVDMAQANSPTGFSTSGTGGLYDSGGYTGDGGKYQPAGIVHKGEVVFSQDDVAAWGGVGNVESLRQRRMPSFAGGGAVSERVATTSVPQVPFSNAGQPPVPVTVQMKGKLFDRGMLADLIDGLNVMYVAGYKLKVA